MNEMIEILTNEMYEEIKNDKEPKIFLYYGPYCFPCMKVHVLVFSKNTPMKKYKININNIATDIYIIPTLKIILNNDDNDEGDIILSGYSQIKENMDKYI